MQVRENLAMDAAGTTFTTRKTYTISRFTLFFLAAITLCTIIAAGLLIYNFATCPEIQVQSQVCETNHVIPLTHNSGSTLQKPSLASSQNASNSAGTITASTSHQSDESSLRLPESVVPISYNIKLIPFLFEHNFTFSGEVKIIVNVTQTCQNITLHATSLKIKSNDVTVRLLNDTLHRNESANSSARNTHNTHGYAAIRKVYPIEPKQFLIIEFNHTLYEGALYEIHIKYVGILNDLLQGFYRSAYIIGNETRWVAATQFQPTDARRALPCFDEPALKARFKLTLARFRNMTSLSNMPQISNSTPVAGLPGYFWDEYQESVPMSTYLLAFVVVDFAHMSSGRFKVWARPDAILSANYSLSIGPKVLKFYESFFNIPYPLPKVDMISLPDFTAGAMENWGLITFREAAMLYEEGTSARINKQRVSTVVAHELAHQWFGNLVTPSWWSDLWLNEGFATYMEYIGIDAVEPSWKSMDQFVLNEVQAVFTLDALSTSHKIWIEVRNPDEINEIFDRISYGKGAAIIRMMYHFLTEQVFKDGLSSFLKEKAYKAADQNDLWFHLTQQARLSNIFDNETSVKEIMDTWTLQTGFPEVNVTRNYQTQEVVFKQNRFMYVTNKRTTENPLWWVPLSYTTSRKLNFNATRPTNWIRKTDKMTVSDIDVGPDEWLLVNIQQTAYYRVNYDRQNWKLLIKYLEDPNLYKNIAPANRAQLVDDALNLARGGSLDYQIALDITKYLVHENDYVPWKAAINSLNFIDSMFMKSGEYYKMKKYFIHLIDHVYKDVRFDDPPESDMLRGYKRVDILTAACHLGYPDCVENSVRVFANWMSDPNPDRINPVSANLRQIVYCTAVKYGDQKEWDFAWERFQHTTVSSEKEILLSALGCSREAWILTRYLERSLSDEHGIRKHDLFRVFAAVSSNVLGQPIAFNFIRSNWRALKEYLGPSYSNLHSIVKYNARRINNGFELAEFKHFAEHIKEHGRAIHQAIETAEANIEWMNKNYKTIVDWLTKIKYDS